MPTPARILIIDDDPHVLDAHARYLRALGHEVETASDGIEGLALLELGADLVMVDAEMPIMDGFSVAVEIRKNPEYETLPIVMVTGLVRQGYRLKAYEVGINDFINKPVDPDELKLRLRWLLELKSTRDQLSELNAELEGAVERRTKSLKKALAEAAEAKRLTYQINLEMLRRLTVTAEYKDPGAVGHVSRVGRYCELLAGAMGFSPQEAEVMRHAAPLHDIGKTAISDSILFKPGPLDENEWVTMRSHTTIGGEILAGSQSQVLQVGATIARSHHELWEGGGYPDGLKGGDIPKEARICAVADYFDALTMDRPFRKAFAVSDAARMVEDSAFSRFEPAVVDVFFRVWDDIEAIRMESAGKS